METSARYCSTDQRQASSSGTTSPSTTSSLGSGRFSTVILDNVSDDGERLSTEILPRAVHVVSPDGILPMLDDQVFLDREKCAFRRAVLHELGEMRFEHVSERRYIP